MACGGASIHTSGKCRPAGGSLGKEKMGLNENGFARSHSEIRRRISARLQAQKVSAVDLGGHSSDTDQARMLKAAHIVKCSLQYPAISHAADYHNRQHMDWSLDLGSVSNDALLNTVCGIIPLSTYLSAFAPSTNTIDRSSASRSNIRFAHDQSFCP